MLNIDLGVIGAEVALEVEEIAHRKCIQSAKLRNKIEH